MEGLRMDFGFNLDFDLLSFESMMCNILFLQLNTTEIE